MSCVASILLKMLNPREEEGKLVTLGAPVGVRLRHRDLDSRDSARVGRPVLGQAGSVKGAARGRVGRAHRARFLSPPWCPHQDLCWALSPREACRADPEPPLHPSRPIPTLFLSCGASDFAARITCPSGALEGLHGATKARVHAAGF